MLEHVPHRHGHKRRGIRIEQQATVLEPFEPGWIDVITKSRSRLPPPQIDESTRANTDVDQRPAEMTFDEFAARRHQAAPEFSIRIVREAIKISLIVGHSGWINRIVADADFRPPNQATCRKLLDQWPNWPITSAMVLSQGWRIFVHRQNFSGMAKPIRLRSSRGSVIFSGALWPPWPPRMTNVFVRSASPAGTIQPTPPMTISASRTSARSSRTDNSPWQR